MAIPAALVAYSAWSAAQALPDVGSRIEQAHWTAKSWLDGEATAAIDSTWSDTLPHRDFASGIVGAGRWLALGEGKEGVVPGRDGWLFTAEEARSMPEPLSASLARIAVLKDTLNEMGVALTIVPLAGKADIYRDETGNLPMADDLKARYDDVLASLRAMGIDTVDSRTALVHEAKVEQVFYASDTHWTREGAAAVARAIAADLPQGETEFTPVETETIAFHGDLTKFITTADYADAVGLREETAHLFKAEAAGGADGADIFGSGDDLFAAAAMPTVLVGTSYSANPDWSFQESLKIALQSDIVNYAQEGRGPVKPFLKMLADPAFRDTPPKTVIWEIPVRYLSDPTIWEPEEAQKDQPILAGGMLTDDLARIEADVPVTLEANGILQAASLESERLTGHLAALNLNNKGETHVD
ncbi:hypothetical protein AYJ57_24965 (plasmid) [Salipiger sp. CCB-MM3]|nr:hypothetical protein AYJ57_24965 [Salipiger sp. CCB-MM3]